MPDAYEREQMPGVGQVLHRHKATVPKWIMALTSGLPLVVGTLGSIGFLTTGHGLEALGVIGGGAALSALLAAVSITFSSARVVVSEGEIHVQLGFAGPRIPISEVARVTIAPSGTNKYGMGVGNDLRGNTTFRMLGDNARAVHVERKDGKRLILVCKDPDAMAQAIQEALARRDAGPRVRVAADDDAESADEGEADAKSAERAER